MAGLTMAQRACAPGMLWSIAPSSAAYTDHARPRKRNGTSPTGLKDFKDAPQGEASEEPKLKACPQVAVMGQLWAPLQLGVNGLSGVFQGLGVSERATSWNSCI